MKVYRALIVLILVLGPWPSYGCNNPTGIEHQLYELLRPKVDWLDISPSFNQIENKIEKFVIRYYPCFSSDAIMDLLLRQALAEGMPKYKLVNPGMPFRQDGYCGLRGVGIGAVL